MDLGGSNVAGGAGPGLMMPDGGGLGASPGAGGARHQAPGRVEFSSNGQAGFHSRAQGEKPGTFCAVGSLLLLSAVIFLLLQQLSVCTSGLIYMIVTVQTDSTRTDSRCVELPISVHLCLSVPLYSQCVMPRCAFCQTSLVNIVGFSCLR